MLNLRKRLTRLWLLSAVLLLSACASQAPLPANLPLLQLGLPLQVHIQRQSVGPQHQQAATQDWLLVIQQEPDALRWSLLDPLGLPLARQLLTPGSPLTQGQRWTHPQWRNDGLLPPNPEARELFAALLFALSPRAELPRAYPALDWQADAEQRRLIQPTRRWQVQYRQPAGFELRVSEGLRYIVNPLAQEPSPQQAPSPPAPKTPQPVPQPVPPQRPGAQP